MIDSAIAFVQMARDELKSGNMTVLQDFEKMVADIQKMAVTMPKEKNTLIVEKLNELADVVRNFEIELRSLHADVKYELMALNQKQKALKTYETVNYSAPIKKDEDNKA